MVQLERLNRVVSPFPGGQRTRVVGVDVDVLRRDELLERISTLTAGRQSVLVCYVNVDCLNQAVFDRRYRAILHEADLVYADGTGVVWASHLTDASLSQRITLGDVLPDLCRLAVERKLRLFFLGGRPGVAQQAAERLTRQYPGLEIVGTHHGFFSREDEPGIISHINQAQPHLLLVGMGVPKQEKWIWRHREELRVPVLWGVGALLDYSAGEIPRAPVWLRRMGCEWFFRLLVEPKRLWRRYLLGNAFFAMRACALLLIDAALVTVAWLGAYGICWLLSQPLGRAINVLEPYLEAVPLIVGVWLLTCASVGLYRRPATMSAVAELAQVIRVTWVGMLSTMAVAFLLREFSFGRPVVLLAGALTFLLLCISRLASRAFEQRLARRGIGLRRALIIGTGSLANRLKQEIEIWPKGYDVVGFVSDGDATMEVLPTHVVGRVSELEQIIRAGAIDDVFVASQHLPLHQELNLLAKQARGSISFHVISEELEGLAQRMPLGRVIELPLLELPSTGSQAWYEWSKRAFDVVVSALGLLLCLPLWGLIALLIKLESPGPVVFVQQRVGQGGRVFRMYKFRTMNAAASAYEVAPNDLTDPRVTGAGRVLRRWSLDELPQLLNVLRGEMSLVGPRPEMPFLVKRYEPWQRWRLTIRPGLTCLWQVVGRKELPLHHNLEYDLYYVRHRGWLLDLAILLRTLPAVISRRGAF